MAGWIVSFSYSRWRINVGTKMLLCSNILLLPVETIHATWSLCLKLSTVHDSVLEGYFGTDVAVATCTGHEKHEVARRHATPCWLADRD